MVRVVRHVRGLWGRWWWVPWLPLAYASLLLAIGDARVEHWVAGGVCVAIAYAGPRAKRFFVDASPWLAVAIGYDLVRYARAALVEPERVIGCGLRDLELTLLSVAPGVTPQDWFAVHHAPAADLLMAVPYAVFAYLALGYAAYLYFVDRPRMRRYLLAFALANFASFAFWLLLPAAPPWYVRAHGCTIDLSALPDAAALTRVDQLLGIDYFDRFYSRASSVFGALPSMHCAYPVIGLLTAWRSSGWRTRPLHVVYTFWMATAAVYLDHHWITDVIAGWLLALLAVYAANRLLSQRSSEVPTAGALAEERSATACGGE